MFVDTNLLLVFRQRSNPAMDFNTTWYSGLHCVCLLMEVRTSSICRPEAEHATDGFSQTQRCYGVTLRGLLVRTIPCPRPFHIISSSVHVHVRGCAHSNVLGVLLCLCVCACAQSCASEHSEIVCVFEFCLPYTMV